MVAISALSMSGLTSWICCSSLESSTIFLCFYHCCSFYISSESSSLIRSVLRFWNSDFIPLSKTPNFGTSAFASSYFFYCSFFLMDSISLIFLFLKSSAFLILRACRFISIIRAASIASTPFSYLLRIAVTSACSTPFDSLSLAFLSSIVYTRFAYSSSFSCRICSFRLCISS